MQTLTIDPAVEQFLAQFRPGSANGHAAPWQEAGRQALLKQPFPTRKTEAWKYTDLKPLLKRSYRLSAALPAADPAAWAIPGLDADRLVFLNGRYAPALSDLSRNREVLEISSLADLAGPLAEQVGELAAPDADLFAALNAAYAQEGICIRLAPGKAAPAPLHLLYLTVPDGTELLAQTRNLILLERSADLKIVESQHTAGEGSSLRNVVTEIHVGENAGLEYIRLQQESERAVQIDRTEIRIAADARCSVFTFTLGGELVRNSLTMRLAGPNAEAHLLGAYVLSGYQQADHFTQVHHIAPHCFSNELYKGILDGKSTGVFSGRIHVYPDAQKTNAYQSNRNVLLSDTANIFTRPQLEIYADDVKCSHGATSGRLDEQALFYLRARGIPAHEARLMLLESFAGEVSSQISIEPLRAHLEAILAARLASLRSRA